ncbi:hypothetical protein SO802_014193 [Lithocarpus litseifolius]|uniref:Uncharacterized protein n=1 Tax=Lithocarpus litseifolius TaxID=425828 RepID=A0AAW2CQ95_9ROSI
MTTKFNKDMYAKMRTKKDEPLSSLGKRTVRITGKGLPAPTALVTPLVSGTETTRTASPTTSVEEIPTPASKRARLSEWEKDPRQLTIWSDEKLSWERAQGAVTADDLRDLPDKRFSAIAAHHVHKLVQLLGESLHKSAEYAAQKAMVSSMKSQTNTLEAENSTLKKDFIDSMGEANSLKEKVKSLNDDLRAERQLCLEKDEQLLGAMEKLKTIAAKAVEAFQQTDEYNTVLFSWYFKGFELLRRYLVKHPSGVDLESLDLEEVDKEMAADETAPSTAPEGDILETSDPADDVARDV